MTEEPVIVYRLWDSRRRLFVAASKWGSHSRTVWMTAGAAKGVRTRMSPENRKRVELRAFQLVPVDLEGEK